MPDYDVFAPFYDAVMGDRAEHAAYLRELIERHHPDARRILELACGTGSVLRQLRSRYQVTGVDLSPAMLAIAAEKVPEARLVAADMTDVDLGETFDVVLCVYDSINHLLTFEQWERLFDCARGHLAEGGIFVFDINTERKLSRWVDQPPLTSWFGDGNLLQIDIRAEDAIFVWDIKVFEQVSGEDYRLHRAAIREASFPVERVRAALRDRFGRVRVYDQQRKRPTRNSDRLHLVCTV